MIRPKPTMSSSTVTKMKVTAERVGLAGVMEPTFGGVYGMFCSYRH